MNRKKRIERFYLESFLRQAGWHRHKVSAEREQPDFLVDTGYSVVGVEVTRVFKEEGPRGSPVKKAEEKRSEFLRKLAEAYNAQDGPPLRVQALIRDDPDLATVAELAARLRAQRPAVTWGKTEFETRVGGHRRAKFLLMTLPDNEDRYRHWHCISDAVGRVRPVTPKALEEKILEKAVKLGEYRRAAEHTVLLIVADRLRNSGMFQFEPTDTLLDARGFLEVHLFLYPEHTYRVA